MEKIQITHAEFNDILHGVSDQFDTVFNDIPMYHPDHEPQKSESHRDYIEDDGREYRLIIFKNKTTNQEYSFSYVYHTEFGPSFPFDTENVEFVKEKAQTSPPTTTPILTDEQKADKSLWEKYEAGKKSQFRAGMVPTAVVRDICNFLKRPQFTMLELRAKIIPICIEYGVEQKSFWNYIQTKAYKAKKTV